MIYFSVSEIKELSSETTTEAPSTQLVNGRGYGNCYKGRCGQEAACKPLPNNTYTCVCPHDLSPPTAELRCPNRLTGKCFLGSAFRNVFWHNICLFLFWQTIRCRTPVTVINFVELRTLFKDKNHELWLPMLVQRV